jgi:hypothetical protein
MVLLVNQSVEWLEADSASTNHVTQLATGAGARPKDRGYQLHQIARRRARPKDQLLPLPLGALIHQILGEWARPKDQLPPATLPAPNAIELL